MVFLGLLFPTVLYLYRNSLGLIVSYVALYEMPVRAAVLRGWRALALKAFLLLQVSWGIAASIAALAFTANKLRKILKRNPTRQ